MNKKSLTTFTYGLLLLSALFPFILLILFYLFALLITPADGKDGGDLFAFTFIIIGMPLCALLMSIGITLSFILGLFTREKGLLIISTVSLAILAYVFYRAHVFPDRAADGIISNAGYGLFTLPSWLYISYFILLLILSSYWFYKLFFRKSK